MVISLSQWEQCNLHKKLQCLNNFLWGVDSASWCSKMWTAWWRGLCKCKTVGDVHSKFWISSPAQRNISSFFWVAVAVVEVVVVTHANHTPNYKYSNKSITALKDDAHSPASVYWCRTLSAFWFARSFWKMQRKQPWQLSVFGETTFWMQNPLQNPTFQKDKNENLKKTKTTSECMLQQRLQIWINLGQFPKAGRHTWGRPSTVPPSCSRHWYMNSSPSVKTQP